MVLSSAVVTLIVAQFFSSYFEFLLYFLVTEASVEHTTIVTVHIVIERSQVGSKAFQIAVVSQTRNVGYILNIKTHA